jgi:hypothetical protein
MQTVRSLNKTKTKRTKKKIKEKYDRTTSLFQIFFQLLE